MQCSLSIASRSPVRSLLQTRRGFVSAVLLSKSWDKLNVTDLKKEARSRGLSPSGNKSALILRLQEHEKSLSSVTVPPASNVNTPPEIPAVNATTEGETPGIPFASQSAAPMPYYLNVSLPVAAYDEPESAVSIPYTFDFLALPVQAESPLEQDMPKMIVIGGEETYGGASPTHNLLDETDASKSEEFMSSTLPRGKGGILDDMAEDMGLPRLRDLRKSIFKFL